MAEKDPIQEVMEAVQELQKTNDANLKKRDDNLEAKLGTINAHLDKFEPLNQKLTLAEQQNKAMQEQLDRVETLLNRPDMGGVAATDKEAKEFMAAFDRVMRHPSDQRDPVDVALINKRQAALVSGNDAGAGYLLLPPDMQTEIIKNVIELTPIRSIATVRTIGGPSLKGPRRTGTGSATRVGENQARTNTGDPAYGMYEFHAPEMFARMEVSQQMLEDSAYDLMAELREDASEQFAVREGAESISGTGVGQMEGILTNADIAITNSGAAATITADGLIDLFYDLKTAHSRNGMFGLKRTTLGAVRTLKDGNGQYLWATGIANGVPNTILGAAYAEMADMPDVAANAYPVVFGDFKRAFIIVDRIAVSIQVDYTTGADNGLVIFRARKRTGGGVRQAEALRKLKCAV